MASPTPLRLRPLPLSELLDELFRMYRRNFVLLASAGLALQLPALVFSLLAGQYRVMGFLFDAFSNINNPDRINSLGPSQGNPAYLILGYLVAIVLLPVSAGVLIRITTDVAMGRPTTLPGAFARTFSRYFGLAAFLLIAVAAAIVVFIALFLVIAGGIALGTSGNGNGLVIALAAGLAFAIFMVAVVAGLWLAVRLVVAIPAMLEERVGPIRGIRRSWYLVSGHFWRVVGTLVVVYFLQAAVQYALTAVFGLLAFVVPGLSGDARGGILLVTLTLVQVVTSPILAVAITLIYFDLRVRKEALDLDQLADAVAPATPLPPASPLPPPASPLPPPVSPLPPPVSSLPPPVSPIAPPPAPPEP